MKTLSETYSWNVEAIVCFARSPKVSATHVAGNVQYYDTLGAIV